MLRKALLAAMILVCGGNIVIRSAYAGPQPPTQWSPVTDENWTLQCWAITAAARFDVEASRRTGNLVKISARYIVYQKTLIEMTELIAQKRFESYQGQLAEGRKFETLYYEQGGNYADALETLRRTGAVPDADYSALPSHDDELFEKLNDLIRSYVGKDKSSPGSVFNREEIRPRVARILDQYLGAPPRSVVYKGRKFTPVEFARTYLGNLLGQTGEELNYSPEGDTTDLVVPVLHLHELRMKTTASLSELLGLLSRRLRAGEPVIVGYTMIDYEKTQHLGKIGFKVNGLPAPDWQLFDWNDPQRIDHSVLALAAEWNEDGTLKRIFVKNTFDLLPEDNFGFHWMEADYFPALVSVALPDSGTEK
jgi:hypothetical protein